MIGLIGISYKTAPIDIREKFSFKNEDIVPFADFLQEETGISDLVLVSTCNRTELYFTQSKYDRLSISEKVIEAFKKYKSAEHQCSRYFYHKFNTDVVRHLFRVAAGIDSMIIGEDQILGQIKESYVTCTEAALTDAVLMRLFQKSFEAGKRSRTETGIKLGNLSVSSTAVDLCIQEFGDISDKSVLVIGAGETGSLALQNFVKKGIGSSSIINRTKEKAENVAKRFKSMVFNYISMSSQIGKHDIIITATNSPHHLISKAMIKSAQKAFSKPQIFIDLSVPRDIDEKGAEIENIKVFAVDDMQKVIDVNAKKRAIAAEKAKVIIDQMVIEFNDWLISRSLRPAIKTISNNLQLVHAEELENFKHIDSAELKKAVHTYTKHITQRYTRLLIKNLKDLTDNGKNTDSLNFINDLFKLDEKNRRD